MKRLPLANRVVATIPLTVAAKSKKLQLHVENLTGLFTQAIEAATPLHEFEEKTFRVPLDLGRTCLKVLFNALGPGDVGETAQLPEGRGPRRLDELHTRSYLSIFGEFTISRSFHSHGTGRKIEMIPFDAQLGLAETQFSYLLQNWHQSLVMEAPFVQVSDVVEKS